MVIANKETAERAGKVKKTYATLAGAMTMVKANGGNFVFSVTGDEDLNLMKTGLMNILNLMHT